MIGTFYRSPAPNEKAFININDAVEINQTVCIIEAMKLMNEIESEVNGSIAEILVEDGDIVDCGQALMRVKKSKN
jgi:acetyl-CoA carboxylase biotin carboxyl carrier protein